MSRRTINVTLDVRLQAITSILERRASVNTTTKLLQVSNSTIENWLRANRTVEVTGLEESHTWKTYSAELKLQAVLGKSLFIFFST